MKLYTRTGDDGSTGLFGGQRVGKDHPRVEAYGAVDETNACIGFAAVACEPTMNAAEHFLPILKGLQSRLFDVGCDLATPVGDEHESKIRRIEPGDVIQLENWIDRTETGNKPLGSFILPGGTELAGRLHVARTVCRRAERLVVRLASEESINPEAVRYLNRAGDLLFALARRANAEANVPDVPWRQTDEQGG